MDYNKLYSIKETKSTPKNSNEVRISDMIKREDGKFAEYENMGEFVTAERWIHPSRVIDSTELICVLDGRVFINEDGTEYALDDKSILILEPGKPHFGYLESGGGGEKVSFYWLHFRTDMPLPGKLFRDGGSDFYDIKHLLRKLLHTSSVSSSGGIRDALTYAIFCELEMLAGEKTRESRAIIKKVTELVRMNIDKPITVSSIATNFGYNSDYMGKLFRASCGIGLGEYIASERVKRAKDLLLTTELSVKEIAAAVFPGSYNSFIKFFIYHASISPTDFRKRYYGTHRNNK